MSYVTSNMIGVGYALGDDTARFKVGTRNLGDNGSEWLYVEFGAAVTAYQWVAVDENFLALVGTSTLADTLQYMAIAQSTFTSAQYGWVATKGTLTATFSGTAVADVSLYTSATAGQFDDVTSGAEIEGIVMITAVSTQNQTAQVIVSGMHRNHAGTGGVNN